jgi:hypothetical protein
VSGARAREALRDELAKTIWETSRADESTISATGANIVADALLAGPLVDLRIRTWDQGARTFIDSMPIAEDSEVAVELLARNNPYRNNPYRAEVVPADDKATT